MNMQVLVACEESQTVTHTLRKKGIKAYSCDIEPSSAQKPKYHLQCDVQSILWHSWDCVLAFPPCTHLAVSGARHFEAKRKDGRQQSGIDFFMLFTQLDCKWMIENPIGIMSTQYRKPDQIIQPWMFGHGETKATCLWLNRLPLLEPTKIVEGREARIWKMPPSKNRAKERSKTYSGIAEAMVDQWF